MTLLIKPLFSLFAYILKLFVALGYVITGNFAMLPADGGPPARAAVVLHEDGRGTMTVTLADGRRFRGPLFPCGALGIDAPPPRLQRREDSASRHSSSTRTPRVTPQRCSEVAAALLIGAGGSPMQCVFVRQGATSVARCRTGEGRLFVGRPASTA